MRGGYERAIPVELAPLPLVVRQEMHRLIRQGHKVVSVERRGRLWELQFRDGSRCDRSLIRADEPSAA